MRLPLIWGAVLWFDAKRREETVLSYDNGIPYRQIAYTAFTKAKDAITGTNDGRIPDDQVHAIVRFVGEQTGRGNRTETIKKIAESVKSFAELEGPGQDRRAVEWNESMEWVVWRISFMADHEEFAGQQPASALGETRLGREGNTGPSLPQSNLWGPQLDSNKAATTPLASPGAPTGEGYSLSLQAFLARVKAANSRDGISSSEMKMLVDALRRLSPREQSQAIRDLESNGPSGLHETLSDLM